jgi:hypothetical protein
MKKTAPYISVILFFIVSLCVVFNFAKWKKNKVFQFDVYGYHNYLPALLIYNDITQYNYLDSIEKKYRPTHDDFYKYGLYEVEKTKNLCNQYPIGVALFQLPFFTIAHLWTKTTLQDVPDGYSSPYQHATVFSTLLFATLALLLLASFLKNYFSNTIIFFTILLIALGTNFFQYATLESGLSHIYLFFLYCAILYLSEKWYKKATTSKSILLGICIGLCAITRHIDILACLIPLCWYNVNAPKIPYLKRHWKKIALIIVVTFITTLPQLIYWKYVTDQWVYYSYSKTAYFEFDRFRVLHGLFSYRKGWFIYSPLLLLAFIPILFIPKNSFLHFYKKLLFIFFIPMVYLVFSWHDWFYGWSFGCRSLLQTIPLLAIPMALLIEKINTLKKVNKILASSVLLLLLLLNLFQTWQYNHSLIHGTLMNKQSYWNNFLKTVPDSQYKKNIKLQEEIDYNKGW